MVGLADYESFMICLLISCNTRMWQTNRRMDRWRARHCTTAWSTTLRMALHFKSDIHKN